MMWFQRLMWKIIKFLFYMVQNKVNCAIKRAFLFLKLSRSAEMKLNLLGTKHRTL